MFDAFTRLLRQHLPWPAARDAQLLAAWAREHEVVLKRERQGTGLVLEHQVLRHPARLEWGPSQRDYIQGRELRLRLELGLPESLELMVMSRGLAERLEAQAYRQLTRGRQTGIDTSLPEEARWLSMFEPVSLDDTAFNHAFVLVGASGSQARRWVDGELAVRLLRAQQRWLGEERAFVLMTLRGRLYLRLAVQALDEDLLDGLGLLAEAAAARALQLARRSVRPDVLRAGESHPAAASDDGLSSTLQPDPSGPLSDLVLGPGAPGLTVIEDALPSDFEPDATLAARPLPAPRRPAPPH